jgi:Glycosyl transferase family 2
MGAIHSSISSKLVKFCSSVSPIKTFVETGTFHGDSVETAAPYFDELWSVEHSEESYVLAAKRFEERPNIRIEHGESPKFLEDRMEEYSSKPVMFWLDAHSFHDGRTSCVDARTPILRELEAIKSLHPASILLIDDARLYLSSPPEPCLPSEWPDIDDLIRRLYPLSGSHRVIILDDVIVFYPGQLRNRFAEFARENGVNWLHMVYGAEIADNLFSKVVGKKREEPKTVQASVHKMDISVVIPTLNCMQFLPDHLDSIGAWLSQVNEVVVVDSYSTDGTFEAFKRYLNHPNLKILSHPRGLYQSWNFGIRQTTSKYVYISTVGDSIDGAHLRMLENLAEKSAADVVVSPPFFIQENGMDAYQVRWPIHSIFEVYPELDEFQLKPLNAFLFSAINIPCSILGSSASNLYRGDYLRSRPFPEDCSIVGDTAWSLLHSGDAKFHFTRKIGSTFRFHSKTPDMSKSGTLYKVITRLLADAERIAGDMLRKDLITEEEHRLIVTLIQGDRRVSEAKEDFTNARKDSASPWYLSKNLRELRKLKKSRIDEFITARLHLDGLLKSNR